MKPIKFVAPGTVEEAVAALAEAGDDGRVLAGGTDLLVQLRAGFVRPGVIVDVKRIAELIGIHSNGGFRIGASTPGAVIGADAALVAAWPGVVEAAELIGSTQIQGRASIGGNLCNASPAADTVPALIAADAVCTVAGPSGRRDVPVGEVCTAPGRTSLKPGEMVVDLRLPARPAKSGDAYLRFIPRTEMDIAVVGVGVSLTLGDDGVVSAARVGIGAVAPTALLVPDAAAALIGTTVDDDALAALDAAARAACNPIDDKRGTKEYRTKVAGVLARRAAAIALERARSH